MVEQNHSTSLENIKDYIYSDRENLLRVKVRLADGYQAYDWEKGNSAKFHEAGFDSHLTGWVFLQLRELYC